jgi:hypothetical protein
MEQSVSSGADAAEGIVVQAIPRAIDRGVGFFEGRVEALLARHGLTDAAATDRYDLAEVAGAYHDLLASTGAHTVRRVGKELAAMLPWERRIDGAADALAALGDAYAAVHRGDAGAVTFERTGAETGRVVARTPYPAALVQGLLRGVAGEFTDTGYIGATTVETEQSGRFTTVTVDVTWWDTVAVSEPAATARRARSPSPAAD